MNMYITLSRSEVYTKQHYAINLSVTRWKIVFFSWQSENILNNDFWFKMAEQHNDQKKSVKRQTLLFCKRVLFFDIAELLLTWL
jgi:hypothetical protein